MSLRYFIPHGKLQLKHLADAYIQESPRAGKWPYDAFVKIEAYRDVLVRQKRLGCSPSKKRVEVFANVGVPTG